LSIDSTLVCSRVSLTDVAFTAVFVTDIIKENKRLSGYYFFLTSLTISYDLFI
jgi:hypothetical protein